MVVRYPITLYMYFCITPPRQISSLVEDMKMVRPIREQNSHTHYEIIRYLPSISLDRDLITHTFSYRMIKYLLKTLRGWISDLLHTRRSTISYPLPLYPTKVNSHIIPDHIYVDKCTDVYIVNSCDLVIIHFI